MIVYPAVSRIAETWQDGRTLRLNMIADINKAFAEKVSVTDTPTFILFSRDGKEIQRWQRKAPTIEELPK